MHLPVSHDTFLDDQRPGTIVSLVVSRAMASIAPTLAPYRQSFQGDGKHRPYPRTVSSETWHDCVSCIQCISCILCISCSSCFCRNVSFVLVLLCRRLRGWVLILGHARREHFSVCIVYRQKFRFQQVAGISLMAQSESGQGPLPFYSRCRYKMPVALTTRFVGEWSVGRHAMLAHQGRADHKCRCR
jgi:hypothetical protein